MGERTRFGWTEGQQSSSIEGFNGPQMDEFFRFFLWTLGITWTTWFPVSVYANFLNRKKNLKITDGPRWSESMGSPGFIRKYIHMSMLLISTEMKLQIHILSLTFCLVLVDCLSTHYIYSWSSINFRRFSWFWSCVPSLLQRIHVEFHRIFWSQSPREVDLFISRKYFDNYTESGQGILMYTHCLNTLSGFRKFFLKEIVISHHMVRIVCIRTVKKRVLFGIRDVDCDSVHVAKSSNETLRVSWGSLSHVLKPLSCEAWVKVIFRRQVYSNSSTGLDKSVQGVRITPPSPIFCVLLTLIRWGMEELKIVKKGFTPISITLSDLDPQQGSHLMCDYRTSSPVLTRWSQDPVTSVSGVVFDWTGGQ
jgi:hypothetical protein